jgi:hypothetical protein
MAPETKVKVVRALWIILGAVGVILYATGPAGTALAQLEGGIVTRNGLFALAHLVLIPLAIVILSWLGFVLAASRLAPGVTPPQDEPTLRFPQTPTGIIGLWLVVATLSFLFRLFEVLHSCDPGNLACMRDTQLGVTALAGGTGSMIATVLAYLKHASERRDFRLSYVPWYLARPLLGVLLAAVFYFLLKGGLLVLGEANTSADMNLFGLAGLSSLVGMFSKNAVEKLRDVFATLFASQTDAREQLVQAVTNSKEIKALAPDVQQKIADALKAPT